MLIHNACAGLALAAEVDNEVWHHVHQRHPRNADQDELGLDTKTARKNILTIGKEKLVKAAATKLLKMIEESRD